MTQDYTGKSLESVTSFAEFQQYAKDVAAWWARLNPEISTHWGFEGLLVAAIIHGFSCAQEFDGELGLGLPKVPKRARWSPLNRPS